MGSAKCEEACLICLELGCTDWSVTEEVYMAFGNSFCLDGIGHFCGLRGIFPWASCIIDINHIRYYFIPYTPYITNHTIGTCLGHAFYKIHEKRNITLEKHYLKTRKDCKSSLFFFHLPVPIGLIRPALPGLRTIIGLIGWAGLIGSLWLELWLDVPELRLPLPWLPL